MHAWTWSMIYHAKDTVFNEVRLDFVSILFSIYSFSIYSSILQFNKTNYLLHKCFSILEK